MSGLGRGFLMSRKEEILRGLAEAVVEGDADKAKRLAEEAIKEGIDAYEAIMEGCAKGMQIVSEKFEKGEMFVPEVLCSADAMYAAMDVLKPHIKIEKGARAKVVIGTVEGDIHDIGKNLVKAMLEAAGAEVIDLGRDVPLRKFVEVAKEVDADIIAMSALMTTTMLGMRTVVEMAKKEGLKSKTLIGGAPTSPEFARSIGADAHGKDAAEAVRIVKELVQR
jgi:corrinoid protein of di/trimethylamine methyltransferase